MQEEIVEVLVPSEDVVGFHKGKKQISRKKMFPGYILIKMEMNTKTWHVVKSTPRVTAFVGGVSPSPIPESDVNSLIHMAKERAARMVGKFVKGDSVEIIDGPFQSFIGAVEEVNENMEMARVIVSIFGRQTPVEVAYHQIKHVG